jgi:hypothetical protein
MRRFLRTPVALGAALIGAWLSSAALAQEPHGSRSEPSRPSAPARAAAPERPYQAPAARPGTVRPPVGAAGPARYDGRGQMLDARYNHGRYYAPVGSVARTLPGEYRAYYHRGAPYYFSGGVWYAPRGAGFVVVTPPVGLVISVLPPYYSTVWIGGTPYYYADNVYYAWQPDQSGYVVATPPDDGQGAPPADGSADPGAGAQPAQQAPADFIIYPKQGQSKDQQAADEYECHNWSKGQTGFDPTQPNGGVTAADADRAHSYYDRAMAACLQGRGYQVN